MDTPAVAIESIESDPSIPCLTPHNLDAGTEAYNLATLVVLA
jgi:hypothetical protein